MTLRLSVRPEAALDFEAAAPWYESKHRSLGERFLIDLGRAGRIRNRELASRPGKRSRMVLAHATGHALLRVANRDACTALPPGQHDACGNA